MSGQIPFDQLLAHGPFNASHIVNVAVSSPPQLAPIAALYAIELLNSAYSHTSTSNGRRYAFNLLVHNNFNNNYLNRYVDLALRIGWRAVINRQATSLDLPVTVKQSCEYACAALAAEEVMRNANILSSDLPPQAVENLRRTLANYQTDRPALDQITWQEMNLSGIAQQPAGAYYSSPNTGTTMHSPTMPFSTPVGAATITTGAEWDQVSTPSSGPQLSQAAFVQSETTIQPTPMGAIRPTASQSSPVEQAVVQPKVTHYDATPSFRHQYPKTVTTHKGQHEMDALRHSRPYFGSLEISAQAALLGFQGTSFKMVQDNQLNKSADERLTVEKIQILGGVNDIFDMARREHRRLSSKMKTPQYLTRVLGIALNPAYADRLVQEMLPDMFAGDIRDIGKRLSTVVNCKDTTRPTPEQHNRLVSAAYIDRSLGRALNDFLARGLRIKASVSTFADSLSDCTNHVQSSLPADFGVLYNAFLNTLEENLRKYATKDIVEMLFESMLLDTDEKPNEDDGIVVVPVAHTVTYCNMTSEELEWTTSYRGTDIDGKVTPTLDQICMTLREDKFAFDFKSTYDWLLTGDGETFLVYENPESKGGYRLFPVSGLNINRLV